MALARIFDAAGWSTDDYDQLIERMDLGGHSAPGVLFNWCASTDDGVRVVDVYEGREVADGLAEAKIGPIVAEMGLPMPEITELEVHSYLTPVLTTA